MAKEGNAAARWTSELCFDVTSGSGHTLTLDSEKAAGPSPMELLVVALAGCTGMDVISTLKKMRQDVRAYEVKVHGVRAEEHPQVYTAITVEHVVTGHAVEERAVERAIELSETKYCGVSNTLNKTARLTTSYQIVESGE
ncbi:MAG TPA: OsmC family protein [Ktedonobacterales bacterium]|nr:OsmC family protein [Ktedonobacterales bacterium]